VDHVAPPAVKGVAPAASMVQSAVGYGGGSAGGGGGGLGVGGGGGGSGTGGCRACQAESDVAVVKLMPPSSQPH